MYTRNYEYLYVKTKNEIDFIEESCKIVAETLALVETYMQAGRETLEIDKIAEDYIRSKGGKPAFKGYQVDKRFFPGTLCISIDEEVVHGIPGSRRLKEGEIVSVDCGVKKNGYYGDAAATFAIGEISDEKKKLMKVTEEALMLGIEQAVPRNKVFDISRAIQEHVERNGFSVTRELVGHGVGRALHEEPPVPNFVPPLLHRSYYPNIKLEKGLTLAIEPMVHAGRKEVKTLADGWTVVTLDSTPSAHFEHTIVIDDKRPVILTLRN